MTHEHYIVRGNKLPKFRDSISVPSAVNLTGASYQFLYQKPDEETVTRSASLVAGTAKPNATAATSFDLEFAPIAEDTAETGVFNYHWRINLQGENAPLDVPTEVAPEEDGAPRIFQRFEVTPALS